MRPINHVVGITVVVDIVGCGREDVFKNIFNPEQNKLVAAIMVGCCGY
jgi:hypothetical protein